MDLSEAKCVAMHSCDISQILHDNTTFVEPFQDHLGFSLLPLDSIMIGDKVVAKCNIEGKIFSNIIPQLISLFITYLIHVIRIYEALPLCSF